MNADGDRAGLSRTGACLAAVAFALASGGLALSQLDPLHAALAKLAVHGDPLYLPHARTLELLSLGHRTTVADLLYLWSVQHLGDPSSARDRAFTVRLYDTITDVDPHFRDAYWLGFVSLEEARAHKDSFALVDKALVHEPDFALLAIEAALTARLRGDTRRAEHYLRVAAERGHDPLAQRLLLRVASLATAQDELAEWDALLASDDPFTRAVAESHVRDLRVLVDVEHLQALAACWERDHGLAPASLEQLVTAGWLPDVPRDPEGEPYVYDARTRVVRSRTPYRNVPPSRSQSGVDLADLGRCAP